MNKTIFVAIVLAIASSTMVLYAYVIGIGMVYTADLTSLVEKPIDEIANNIATENGSDYKEFENWAKDKLDEGVGLSEIAKVELDNLIENYLGPIKQGHISNANDLKGNRYKVSENLAYAFGIVAGIITSIVTAVFAVTRPNDPNPGNQLVARVFKQDRATYESKPLYSKEKISSLLINLYIVFWFVFGGMCFYFCFLTVGDGMPRIDLVYEHGRLWFGLATGAIIALLAINPVDG